MPILVAVVAFVLLFALIQVGAIAVAFDKLGLSPNAAIMILMASLIGSGINLPLFQLTTRRPHEPRWRPMLGALEPHPRPKPGRVVVGLNVGGGLIPLAVSIYLLSHHRLPLGPVIVTTALMAGLCYLTSRPIPGRGVGMPLLVAPLMAAALGILALPQASAPLAYIAGTMGVLLGADILRLDNIRDLGVPSAAIGGAGTFDGIFITGIVAVLLA